jgi:hypothetical protein
MQRCCNSLLGAGSSPLQHLCTCASGSADW